MMIQKVKYLVRFFSIVFLFSSIIFGGNREKILHYSFKNSEITVDAKMDDWKDIIENRVEGSDHLWFGQNMTPEKWHGNSDLSYSWKGAWNGNKIYFLFEVTDNIVMQNPQQPNSFLNDAIEILLDHKNSGGPRVLIENDKKVLRGYEMHFLPTKKVMAFVDDALSPMYPIDNPQTDYFVKTWAGEAEVKMTKTGYVMEIGFEIPGLSLGEGMIFGIDTDVCDDDGNGRKSLQIWSGKQVDFWKTMDHYGQIELVR